MSSIFIFLGAKTIEKSSLFDTHQYGLLKTLYENKIIKYKHVLMSIFITKKSLNENKILLDDKIEKFKQLGKKYNFKFDYILIYKKGFSSLEDTVKRLCNKASNFDKRIIFCQNLYCGYIGYKLKNKLHNTYLHLNFRGVPAEEELYYSKSSIIFRVVKYIALKRIEKLLLKKFDSFSVVSLRFKTYLDKKINKSKNIIVYPCAYNKKLFYFDSKIRKKFREKFKIKNDKKILLYSGSLEKWQMPENIFSLFENLCKQDKYNQLMYVFLTFEKHKAIKLASKYNIKNIIIETATGEDLLGFYNMCDIGVICRNDDLVNNVASPTKVAEYLATQNSIILTKSVGDYGFDLLDKKYAIVKNSVKEFDMIKINEVKNLISPTSEDIKWIKLKYGANQNITNFKEIFTNI